MWQIYEAVQKLIDKGARDNALTEIAKYRAECVANKFSPLLVLQADCIAQEGTSKDFVRAIEILEEAAKLDPDNFWIFYNLGHYLTEIGRTREALAAIWNSH